MPEYGLPRVFDYKLTGDDYGRLAKALLQTWPPRAYGAIACSILMLFGLLGAAYWLTLRGSMRVACALTGVACAVGQVAFSAVRSTSVIAALKARTTARRKGNQKVTANDDFLDYEDEGSMVRMRWSRLAKATSEGGFVNIYGFGTLPISIPWREFVSEEDANAFTGLLSARINDKPSEPPKYVGATEEGWPPSPQSNLANVPVPGPKLSASNVVRVSYDAESGMDVELATTKAGAFVSLAVVGGFTAIVVTIGCVFFRVSLSSLVHGPLSPPNYLELAYVAVIIVMSALRYFWVAARKTTSPAVVGNVTVIVTDYRRIQVSTPLVAANYDVGSVRLRDKTSHFTLMAPNNVEFDIPRRIFSSPKTAKDYFAKLNEAAFAKRGH